MNSFYYKTFARLALLPYIGGTVIHIVRLIVDFPIDEMPWEADWLVVLVGGYAGLGLLIYAHRVPFKNLLDKIIYGLLIFHLDGSVILHTYILWTGSHDTLIVSTRRALEKQPAYPGFQSKSRLCGFCKVKSDEAIGN